MSPFENSHTYPQHITARENVFTCQATQSHLSPEIAFLVSSPHAVEISVKNLILDSMEEDRLLIVAFGVTAPIVFRTPSAIRFGFPRSYVVEVWWPRPQKSRFQRRNVAL
jgi:hypothetical protein